MGWDPIGDVLGFTADVMDDVLGFDPPKVGAPAPAPAPAVATTDPATNTPTPTPAQTSFDRAQSYLAIQRQNAFNEQLKQFSKGPEIRPPTFSQTEQGQKMIKFGIVAAFAWLFLFKGKL